MAIRTVIMLLSALAFISWSVSVAGLSSLQTSCEDSVTYGGGSMKGIERFSADVLECNRIYRYAVRSVFHFCFCASVNGCMDMC